jgi:hypothetical protein
MVLLKHPRPAGFVALLMLGIAAAGPAFARTGLQSEHYEILPQMAQADPSASETDSTPSFDHGENSADRAGHLGAVGHARGDHGHGDHGHGGGRGR